MTYVRRLRRPNLSLIGVSRLLVSELNYSQRSPTDEQPYLGFTVSVPIKPLRNRDTPARDEIAFEWDTPLGDFYDRVCARMDVDPRTARIGYKFEVDPKRSIREIPPGNTTGYNAMLDKVKDRIARARTRQVILEIHNLVRLFCCLSIIILTNCEKEAKRLGRKKKQNVPAPDSMTVRQTRELGILKRKLSCVDSNHRPWCWVASDGSHRSLTIFQVTLWAQLIVCGSSRALLCADTNSFSRPKGQPRTIVLQHAAPSILYPSVSIQQKRYHLCHPSTSTSQPS